MNRNYTQYLLRFLLPPLLSLLLFASCKEVIDEVTEPPNKINISGDYSGNLDVFLPYEEDGKLRLSSIADSSSITYPSFYLERNDHFVVLTVVADQKEKAIRYYHVNDVEQPHVPNSEMVKFEEVTLYKGEGVVEEQIFKKLDANSIILNGEIIQK